MSMVVGVQIVNIIGNVVDRLSHWHDCSSIGPYRTHVLVQRCNARSVCLYLGYVSIDRLYARGIFFDRARKPEFVFLKG